MLGDSASTARTGAAADLRIVGAMSDGKEKSGEAELMALVGGHLSGSALCNYHQPLLDWDVRDSYALE